VRQALAAARAANAARFPQITGTGDVTRERFSERGLIPPPYGGKWVTIADLTANLSFDLDLWGRNRATFQSALDQSHAAAVDAYSARLFLSSSIVHSYVQLQRAYDQLDVAEALLKDRQQTLDLVRQRTSAGLDSQIDVKQAEAALPEARERIAQLQEVIQITRNQLAALVGQGPDRGLAIERPRIDSAGAFALPAQLPAELIGRRPDVVARRWRVEAARQDIKAARAEFYPNVNLVAFLGLQSIGLSHLLQAGNRTMGIGPAVSLPIFDAGRLRANLAGRNAEYDVAVEQYNGTLVDALREVVDQIAASRSVDIQRKEVQTGLETTQRAYDLTLIRYKQGLATYLQVLNAETQVLTQRALKADLRARELDVVVNLTRALGGGYNETKGAPIVGALKN
jgi:NodT family efflux transporter outer membrane factor (OMF) lipoprotein